jgi:FMN phosphatase YigB (HAD superfamily)
MSSVAEPELLIKTLLSATRHMIEDPSPSLTLEAKFNEAFYPLLGVVRRDVQGFIDTFYQKDFPLLQGLTKKRPDAVRVVDQVIKRGDQAAVATNPLFPLTAILQRLDWAGLPADQVPFVMIPSYETFHFAKPNPAYFAEFMAQLGWPKTPVVMVGNDVESDIGAARQLGLPVFWMTNNGTSSWNGQGTIPPHGGFSDLIPWMDETQPEPLQTNFTTRNALLAVLRSTPAALDTLCRRFTTELEARPAQGEWSPGEVLCHLRDVDMDVNLVRLRKVLSEHNPFLPGQETDPWADERQYCLQDGLQALNDFTQARLELLHLLENLPSEDWDRPARHAIFGPTHLRELVNIIAGHDILHVQQVYKALHLQK